MTAGMSDRVQRSFSRSFDTYASHANQQAWVAERLSMALRECGAPHRFASTFEIGCGTGLLTQQLYNHFRHGELKINDLAPEAQQIADAYGATFLQGDATQIRWPDMPELIASASMIQWLANPATMLRRAADALVPGGWLAVSGFGPRQYEELVQIGTSGRAPGLRTAEDMAAVLRGDLEIMTAGQCLRPMQFSSARDVLVHLRKTGVNGRAGKAWTRSQLENFLDDYTRQFANDAGVTLTYHPVWIIARKPDCKQPMSAGPGGAS